MRGHSIPLVVIALLACLPLPSVAWTYEDLYCGVEGDVSRSCYSALGVGRDATPREVKRAYRALALRHHPDKSSEEGTEEKFRRVATAYEVLKDPESRAEYDDFLDHPEDVLRNKYRYYRRYSPKTSLALVLSLALLAASLTQYFSWYSRYLYVRRSLLRNPEVKKRIEQRRAERAAEPAPAEGDTLRRRRKQGGEEADIDELEGIVEVSGWQGRPPRVVDLFLFRVPAALLAIVRYFYWLARWYVLFTWLGREYGYEEREYITQQVLTDKLGAHPMYWKQLGPDERAELVAKELWDDNNLLEFRRYHKNKNKRRWR